jgi:single-stranded-DNA-specific exonuclease
LLTLSVPPLPSSKPSRQPAQRAIPDQRWQVFPNDADRAALVATANHLSPLIAQVLLNRRIETAEQAAVFLDPDRAVLPSPLEDFPDLALSVELLSAAIEQGTKIAICGDYDADGMTSTALLLRALRYLGAEVDYAIPSRMSEGYGINTRIIEDFHAEGVGLVLTVDNGIAAVAPIARARELGLNVIITDHHDVPPILPPANAILNPKLIAETSPYRTMAGVGVAYILALCLAQSLGKGRELQDPLLELFTLGTIADLAALTGVNRRWVRRGLKLLAQSKILGIQTLIQVSGLGGEKNIKPEAIGFRLGPRINAIGRIGDPQIVIEMLTTDDEGLALERAMQCEQINQQRQQLCEQISIEAVAAYENGTVNAKEERVLLLVQPDWHHGVIGIVASRLVERYGVPVFIGTYEDEAKTHIRGSARSIPEFNVFEALEFCKDLTIKHGGHRAAGGFSFDVSNLALMGERLSQFAHQSLELQHLKPLITVDVQANFADLDMALYQQIDQLHPCGMENPDPVFWTPNVRIVTQKMIGKGHLKVTLDQPDGPGGARKFSAIAWRWGEYYPLPQRLDIAYRLRTNEWQGDVSLELELIGVRLPNSNQQSLDLTGVEIAGAEVAEMEAAGVKFICADRPYHCQLITAPNHTELHIRNTRGDLLMVTKGDRSGRLSQPADPQPKTVDVTQAPYYDLVKAAALAIQQVSANHSQSGIN